MIRNLRLIVGIPIITIQIFPNISRSKGNQTMKLGQLIEYNVGNIVGKIMQKIRRLVPDVFLFFQKALYEVKASDHHLGFNIIWQSLTWTYNKNKLYKTSDC